MRKRRVVLMLIGVGVLVAALMFVTGAFRKKEPVFAGKALSYWVLRYATDRPPYHGSGRNGAVREIGTNTIPYLLSWIKYDPPAWKSTLFEIVRRWNPSRQVIDNNERLANGA